MSVVIATLLTLYVDGGKVSAFLKRHGGAGVVAAAAVAVATPLCSCGTTAVILGMMASRMSWAPIVAFMVASPLTSPQGLVYSAGLFGWPFALSFYLSSIILGLAAGGLAALLEVRGWLTRQARLAAPAPVVSGMSRVSSARTAGEVSAAFDCSCAQPAAPRGSAASAYEIPVRASRVTLTAILKELRNNAGYLLLMFLGFAFIGYLLNGLIPDRWVATVFGSGNIYNVPLAATLGLPLYINSEASLPLIRALLEAGMNEGAALAFLVCGAGTSIGAIMGALTIARWRVIALVVAVLWAGAILCGLAFNMILKLA